jgi:hypothetical protein
MQLGSQGRSKIATQAFSITDGVPSPMGETMQSGVFMHEVRTAGLAYHLHIARIFLWGGLALALLSAMAWTPWLMETGVLFTGIGVWIMWRVLKSLPTASPP